MTTRDFFHWGVPLAIGLWVGWVVDAMDVRAAVWSVYDDFNPVVTLKAEAKRLDDGRYAVMLSGTKNRDCRIDGVFAYDRIDTPRVIRTRLYAQRVDGAMLSSHPKGNFIAGVPWVITPPPVGKLEIWTRHLCGDRFVSTKAEVVG